MDIGSRGVCLLPISFDSGDFVSVREPAGKSASVFEITAEHRCVVVLCTNTAPTWTVQVHIDFVLSEVWQFKTALMKKLKQTERGGGLLSICSESFAYKFSFQKYEN